MNKVIRSPLTEGELEGAAYLCLSLAAWTDRDQFPPGSGDRICRGHHARKRRFEKAKGMVKEGATNLLELGLFPEDCSWAANMAHRAKDKNVWLSHFQTAGNELRKRINT